MMKHETFQMRMLRVQTSYMEPWIFYNAKFLNFFYINSTAYVI